MSIELKNVTYTYSPETAYEIHALKNINLVIPDGQFMGIIGHTGSGKWYSSIQSISFLKVMFYPMYALDL